jgi:HAE1 family hydrophobic/amphiphilic exporter-1
MSLPELAIRRHVTTLMILVSLVVLGTVAMFRLPLAFLPEIEEPELFVVLPWDNASPEQVERMVVRPVEDALGSVKGVTSMWSRCGTDGGRIRLGFDWGYDLQIARVDIWEKIDRIRRDLPEDLGDIQVSNGWGGRDADQPVLEGRLSSDLDLSESYDLLERRIVKPLERVAGVASVNLDGVNPREVRVDLSAAALERHSIDIRTVQQALRGSNLEQSLGHLRDGDTRFTLRTVAGFGSVDEIRNLPLREDGLRLRDVATVVYEEPPLEYGRHLDGNFAVGLEVSAEANANVVEVGQELEARIAAMNEDPELQGVNFLVWFSQSREILGTLRDLAFTGIFGALLAAVVLYLFLRRVSTTIVSVLSIPFSLIVACGFIWARGGTMNTLTLLGLIVGIGMLVDNAVVVIENIFRHREEGKDQKTAARLGASEVSTAVTAATLTSVIVFLPIIFNKPTEMNLFLKELGITICITLLASLFVSQTMIPMATSWFIKSKPRGRGRLMMKIEAIYGAVIGWLLAVGRDVSRTRLNLRRTGAIVVGLLIVASIAIPFSQIEMNFDTNETELFVTIGYQFSESLSLERKQEMVTLVENHLDQFRDEMGLRSIYSWWSERWTMTRLYLPEGDASPENIEKVRRIAGENLPEIAGVKLEVQGSRQHWRQDRGKRVAFQVVGEDSEVLASLAEEIKERLEDVPGLVRPFAGMEEAQSELHVEPNRDLAMRYGVTPQQISQVVGLTYRGNRLPRYRTPEGEREMRMTLDEREEETLDQLANLPLWADDEGKIPLASVAEFEIEPGIRQIQRDDRLTSIWVGAEYEDGKREDYMPAVGQILAGIEFPYGYSWQWGRWQDRAQEKMAEFFTNLALALLLIFAVMASLFESVRQAIALMIALPFALAGAAWTLWITGTDFDTPAAIGILLLIGVVVNNGIVMIEHINTYRRQGIERSEAILRGGRERVRPILMTALTTLIGLMPIVIQKPSLGGVYYYSMALVIMGGLLLSTILTSVLLPVIVTVVEDTGALIGRAFGWVGSKFSRRREVTQPA